MLNWRTCVGVVVSVMLLYVALGSRMSPAGRPFRFKHRVMFFHMRAPCALSGSLSPMNEETEGTDFAVFICACTQLRCVNDHVEVLGR